MAIDACSLWFSAVSKRRHFQGMGASHFPDKRNRHRLGAHAVSGDAAGGVGGAQALSGRGSAPWHSHHQLCRR